MKTKNKGGRPPKTLKDFNLPEDWKATIYEMSAIGCSEVEIRAKFLMQGGTFSQPTWDALKKREKEFLLTIQQAKVLCQAWWERTSRESIKDKDFQTGNWYANMKNRFGWRDKQDIDHVIRGHLYAENEGKSAKEIRSEMRSVIREIVQIEERGRLSRIN